MLGQNILYNNVKYVRNAFVKKLHIEHVISINTDINQYAKLSYKRCNTSEFIFMIYWQFDFK